VRRRLQAAHVASAAPPATAAVKLASQNKLYVRERISLLLDEGSFVEDGRYANAMSAGLPADGVVTGRGTVEGRPAIVVANDPTVKAGSWGARTVEKIIRATEMALREELPIFWFIDSAGARITDQVDLFPGRRGAGRIFHNQVALSGKVPQICCLYVPSNWRAEVPSYVSEEPSRPLTRSTVPEIESQPFDIHEFIDGLVDEDSFFELKPLYAAELVTGFARMAGSTVGVVANNSAVKGGVLFVDSADKAARFIWLCDAFSIPLLYLADVPGFMIGSEVERAGIIRHGAKMITAVSEATVPQFSVIVRKAYGAGLYAMAGPGFGPDATLALPTARIAVMGPEAAVNAVYANKIGEIADPTEREQFVQDRRREYEQDVDLERLAADLVLDAIIEADVLRAELVRRLAYSARRDRTFSDRRRGVPPV